MSDHFSKFAVIKETELKKMSKIMTDKRLSLKYMHVRGYMDRQKER